MSRTIIIAGDSEDRSLTKDIISVCSKNGGAFVVDRDRIYRTVSEPFYRILNLSENSLGVESECIMIVGRKASDVDIEIEGGTDCICILDSDDRAATAFTKKIGAAAVGCSMSGTDTLTVSGFNDTGEAVVTLLRPLKNYCPGDYVVDRYEGQDVYNILACTAVLMLTGRL